MPSFDIESKVDQHELTNAIDQANRVIGNRFDFKGTDSEILQNESKKGVKILQKKTQEGKSNKLHIKL